MMHAPTSNLLSTFVTLIVTIGPIETAAVFAGLAARLGSGERRSLATRGTAIAAVVLLAFALGGEVILSLMHVSMPAFRVAGGLLLFLQAVTLTFANPGLSSISAGEEREAMDSKDMAVFPLAFPLIAGPGSLSAVVLLMSRADVWTDRLLVLVVLALCLALTWLALRTSESLIARLGVTGADVVGRISGVLLAALAVQFVFDGLRQARLA